MQMVVTLSTPVSPSLCLAVRGGRFMVFRQVVVILVPQIVHPCLHEPGPQCCFYFPLRMRLFNLEYEPRPILGSKRIIYSGRELSSFPLSFSVLSLAASSLELVLVSGAFLYFT